MTQVLPHIETIVPDTEVYEALSSRFSDYNAAHSTWDWRTYCCVVRDGDQILAGGRGVINMGALEVRGLWVNEELRGQGFGKKVLSAIEDEARLRGATRAMLFTFSWQGEKFYELMGYQEFSRFKYPDGPERIDMQKKL